MQEKEYGADSMARYTFWQIRGYGDVIHQVAPYLSRAVKNKLQSGIVEEELNHYDLNSRLWGMEWLYFLNKPKMLGILDTIPHYAVTWLNQNIFRLTNDSSCIIRAINLLTDKEIGNNYFHLDLSNVCKLLPKRKNSIIAALDYDLLASYAKDVQFDDDGLVKHILLQRFKVSTLNTLMYSADAGFILLLESWEIKSNFYQTLIDRVSKPDELTAVSALFIDRGDTGWDVKLKREAKL